MTNSPGDQLGCEGQPGKQREDQNKKKTEKHKGHEGRR